MFKMKPEFIREPDRTETTHGAYIVSWDFTHGEDVGILLVGNKKGKNDVEIINAFQGEEAYELYKKLSTVKKKDPEADSNG